MGRVQNIIPCEEQAAQLKENFIVNIAAYLVDSGNPQQSAHLIFRYLIELLTGANKILFYRLLILEKRLIVLIQSCATTARFPAMVTHTGNPTTLFSVRRKPLNPRRSY